MVFVRTTKISQHLDHKVRIITLDNRTIVGIFKAFDKHMNLVLNDTKEYRLQISKKKKQEWERKLGLVVLRGENIVSLTVVEGPPPKVKVGGFGQSAGHPATSVGNPNTQPIGFPSHTRSPVGASPGSMAPPMRGPPPRGPPSGEYARPRY